PVCGYLRLEVLPAVLPDQLDARLGEHGQLLGGHVLGRREDLDGALPIDLRRRAGAGGVDLLPQALQVGAHALGAQTGDQLSHATPAWRPARGPSRRWEKK